MMKAFMPIVLVTVLLPNIGISQDCIDYGDYLHSVAEVETPGSPHGVAIVGSFAYIADGDGFQVVDCFFN